MDATKINTKNWQLDTKRVGLVFDMDDIRQCIEIILLTRKGTDPLRPLFGCGIFDYIDRPISEAIPPMTKEILEAIATYEPRVTITRIVAEPYYES